MWYVQQHNLYWLVFTENQGYLTFTLLLWQWQGKLRSRLSYINPYPVTKEVNHEQCHSVCVENGSFFINILKIGFNTPYLKVVSKVTRDFADQCSIDIYLCLPIRQYKRRNLFGSLAALASHIKLTKNQHGFNIPKLKVSLIEQNNRTWCHTQSANQQRFSSLKIKTTPRSE